MPLIEPGKAAPDFTLPDQHGLSHRLRDQRGKAVVLYFYPKDDTTGCTDQACQFRDELPRFDKLGVTVFGISPDSVKSHKKFADKYDLPFTLLADARPDTDEGKAKGTPPVCDEFGVWVEKSMYGRKYMGVSRTTYLLNPDGLVIRRWDKVTVPGHAEDVLAALAQLNTDAPPAPSTKTTKKIAKKTSSKTTATKKVAKSGVKKKSTRA